MLSEKSPPPSLDFERLQAWTHTHLASIQATIHLMGPLSASPSPTPATLHIKILGAPEVFCQGQKVDFPYQKVLELLLYLIHHPAATREQLLSDLWDGKTADSVYTAIRQLRKILRDLFPLTEEGVVKKGRHYSLSSQIQVVLDSHDLDGPVLTTQQIAPQYLCDLMDGLDSAWIEEQRLIFNRLLLTRLVQELQVSQGRTDRTLVLHLLRVTQDVFEPDPLQMVLRLSRELGHGGIHRTAQMLQHALTEGSCTRFYVLQLREQAAKLLEQERLAPA
ncbi:winged helix-turn-helix domain-containing protein [Deinococcus cellulosilyticus]|uniref:OmpR/PhoB-type domain-containing protein n=1 Tax=Deinococcus cellulosilyticus (strain DSM 18568 / NBRC 106333 / KACC 11606 / 5516J-15) TaxID=1223518 RepID=A0A511N962_DEIC1|nr:hypothetical protein [Deinococcus cellulosilyticus]GEM49393.1 hypothetical protein DC3_50280 [Deinococcus cellulosilyticus NBRC 106333 = KACC 11606]